jgi:outer membrane protein TolC
MCKSGKLANGNRKGNTMGRIKQLTAAIVMASFALPVSAEDVQAVYSDSLSLHDLTEQVYQRLPGKLGEAKFGQLQQANDSLSSAMFAEPATANLNHFNDVVGSGDGFQEWEGSIDMPLWLPGQKQAQQALSEKIIAELPAYQAELKLQASGEVRDHIWQVKLAETELAQSKQVWVTAKQLEKDVKARVEAGDLPSTEALLAATNSLEAQSQYVQAESKLAEQLKAYLLLTGTEVIPEQIAESLVTQADISAAHPSLALQDQMISRLQAEVGLAQYVAASNPNLSVGVRRERGDDKESFNHSLGVGISIALDDKRYSQPAIAEASAMLTDAQIARQQLEKHLQQQLHMSRASLASSQAQLDLAVEQDKTTQQYFQLQKQAFYLGELNLVELLRSQTLANESRNRKRQLEVLIEQKTAAVNQALGVSL